MTDTNIELKSETAEAQSQSTTILAYKGFTRDWKCRDFQFEIGKTYHHDGPVALCHSGFHACEAPIDIWNYYPPSDGNVAALVELGGVTDERKQDTKRVGKSITIKAALDLPALIKAQFEFVWKSAKEADKAAGYASKAASSGDASTAASSGDSSKAASSGNYSKAASSGNYSTAASSGYASTAASSGDSSKAASSGDASTAASSGDASTAASSGDSSKAASSGNYSKAASSGNYSKAACDTNGFACVAGINGRVKGDKGSAVSLGYRDKQNRNRIAVGYIEEGGLKPDTWYRVNDAGEFIEV